MKTAKRNTDTEARLERQGDHTAPPVERANAERRGAFLPLRGDVVKELGPNATVRLHWAEKGRRVDNWKTQVMAAWHEAGCPVFEGRVDLAITIFRGRTVDRDNATASVKAIIDGLKGRVIVDDSEKYVASLWVGVVTGKVYRDNPMVHVIIEEAQ